MSAGTDIKRWQERAVEHKTKWHRLPPPNEDFMRAEIAELRAALEAAEQDAKAAHALMMKHCVADLSGGKPATLVERIAELWSWHEPYVQGTQPDSGRDAAMHEAAKAVLRDALDRVDVHVCDDRDDSIRAKGLYGSMADLYAAVAAQQGEARTLPGDKP